MVEANRLPNRRLGLEQVRVSGKIIPGHRASTSSGNGVRPRRALAQPTGQVLLSVRDVRQSAAKRYPVVARVSERH
jgi:hypothetical protein